MGFLTLGAKKNSTGTNADLSARVRQQDPEALRQVVGTYLPQILRAARGAGLDNDQAEEVTQRVFTTFLETATKFEGRSSIRTWVFGILYRKLLEQGREQERRDHNMELDEAFDSRFAASGRWSTPPRPADAEASDKEVRRQISSCLAATPERQRMAFLLREVEGFSTAEISEILGMTRTNLGVALHRVRNRLRECLEGQGVTPTA